MASNFLNMHRSPALIRFAKANGIDANKGIRFEKSVYHWFCIVLLLFFYAVAKESEEHREKIERLHRRISSVDKNRNKTPLVSLNITKQVSVVNMVRIFLSHIQCVRIVSLQQPNALLEENNVLKTNLEEHRSLVH